MAGQARIQRLVIGVGHVHERNAVSRKSLEAGEKVVAAERDVLDALALVGREVLLDLRFVVQGFVDRDADLAAGADHGPALEPGDLALDVEIALFAEVEQPLVELRPFVHAPAMHVVGQMVDVGQTDAGTAIARTGAGVLDGDEVDIVDGALAIAVDEIDQAAADAPDRRDIQLHRPDMAVERLGAELERAGVCPGTVRDPERYGRDRRPVHPGEGLGEAAGLGVDDEVDVALAIEGDILGAVPGDGGEAHPGEQLAQGLRLGRGVFDELETIRPHGVGGIIIRCIGNHPSSFQGPARRPARRRAAPLVPESALDVNRHFGQFSCK